MKKRRQRKCLLLLFLYTLLLLLLPCLLGYSSWWRGVEVQGGQQEKEVPARHCPPSLEGSLPVWNIEDGETVDREGPIAEDVNPSQGPKQHIYLHATWRTGSSFLGELFNQHHDVFYLYEPMWHLWQALYPGDAESLQGALRDMLRSLFLCDFSVLRLYAPGPWSQQANLSTNSIFGWNTNKVICSPPLCPTASQSRAQLGLLDGAECRRSCPPRPLQELEAECRRYPAVVIKDVRLLDAGVLLPLLQDPALNLRIIQLFRDPRAVHNSRLKSKQALLRESVQVLRSRHREESLRHLLLPPPGAHGPHLPRTEAFLSRALEVICDAWLNDLLLFSSTVPHPPLPESLRRRYASLRYEDLVREPSQQLARLLRFAGLAPLPELEAFALNLTRGPGYPSDKPFLISARDAREAVGAWRERLSRRQVQQVEEACHGAMTVLSYTRSPRDNPEEGGALERRNT